MGALRTAVVIAAILLTACGNSGPDVAVDNDQFLAVADDLGLRPAAALDVAQGTCGLLASFYGDDEDLTDEERYAREVSREVHGSPDDVFEFTVGVLLAAGEDRDDAYALIDATMAYQCGLSEAYADWLRWSR